jgi:hypothetical protein
MRSSTRSSTPSSSDIRNSVLVSGSFPDSAAAADLPQRRLIEEVARGVGRIIAERDKRLVSGSGLVVGSAAIAGALSVILKQDAPNLEKSLLLRPFPREPPEGITRREFRRRYRDSMVQQVGICVFVAGLKDQRRAGKTKRIVADGVVEEFESAKRLGRTVIMIPLGATGGAAANIWKLVKRDLATLYPFMCPKDFDLLNNTNQSSAELVKAVNRIIEASEKPLKRSRELSLSMRMSQWASECRGRRNLV